jgi:hypothetical protein
MSYKKSMKKATNFYELNKETILHYMKDGGLLFSMELDSKELSSLFDQYAGIDYVLLNKQFGKLYGIAARVNFWQGTKGCLTIRYSRPSGAPTEYFKRLSSIMANDSFYPHITMQIDAEDNIAVSGIMVSTKFLYYAIHENHEFITNHYMNTCKEGNEYLKLPFEFIRDDLKVKCSIFEMQEKAHQIELIR